MITSIAGFTGQLTRTLAPNADDEKRKEQQQLGTAFS